MDFGKIPETALKDIDFTLPPDPKVTIEILNSSKKKNTTKFHVGCAKWGRKDWIGKLYPKGTKEKDFLEYYAKQFNCIEFNGFYYQLHPPARVKDWISKVPKDFLFCPKFTEVITHRKRLKNTKQDIDAYLEVVSEFKEHLGPIFLMPHPQMNPKQMDTLEEFITDIPKDIDLFLELRHPDWYLENGYNTALYDYLKKHKRGTIITDAAGRRDCVHMHLSTPECFIRFVGNGLHPTDYTRIDEWVNRIKKWMHEGLETCYFFMHQHEELHSPELIKYFIEQMNKHCGTDIKAPVIHNEGNLF